MNDQRTQGFTLIELLLSITIIAVLFSVGVPVYQSFQNANDLDIAAVTLVQSQRRAQILSRGMEVDSAWGVYVTTGTIRIFKGATYAVRDATYDEDYQIASSINISGNQEYNFNKFTGLPVAIGTTILTSVNNETRSIAINSQGTINY